MEQDNKVEDKKEENIPTEAEVKATSMGWKPKEHWVGNPDDFIDAAEFIRRKPLFDKIESQKVFYDRKLKDVETTLHQLAQHHTKVKELEYQRALKDLRLAKREAMEEGDTKSALLLEDKMEDLSETHKQELALLQEEQKRQSPTGPTQEFLVWVQQNSWYTTDSDMHDFAEGVAAAFIRRGENAGRPPTEHEVFSHVNEKVRKAYPEKFENPNRERASSVSSGDRNGKGAPKVPAKLPAEYEDIARNFERNGVMTRDEYIKQLSEMGVI